jgi:recombination protein RecT
VSDTKALQVARDNYVAVRQEISDRATSELSKLLSPEKAERFVAIGLRSLAKNPGLLAATPKSLTNAFYDAAVLGLEPVLGSVYFVKYGSEATMLIGYRGLVELAKRGDPDIEDIYGQPVYAGDDFDYEYGDNPHLRHKPDLARQTADPTRITHFYAIAFRGRGRPVFAVMTRDEVDAIRARSRAKNNGPWVTDYAAMGAKTVVRQLCSRRLSLSADIREALERDAEREYERPVSTDPDNPGAKLAAAAAKTLSLRESLKAQVAQGVDAIPVEPSEMTDEEAGIVAVEIAGEAVEVPAEAIVNAEEVAEGAPVVVTPRPSADPQTNGAAAKCKDVSPYGSGALCDRQAGHGGSHMSGTGKNKEAW